MSKIKTIAAGQTHTDGLLLGVTGEKVALFGATPVIQPVGATQAAIGVPTYAAPNASALNTGDATSDTVIGSIRTQLIALAADVATHTTLVNKLRLDLIAVGAIKGAA